MVGEPVPHVPHHLRAGCLPNTGHQGAISTHPYVDLFAASRRIWWERSLTRPFRDARPIRLTRWPAQVDHFTIFCPLRIAIKPLLPVAPVMGNLTLAFIGKPTIDFSLAVAGGTLDMMAIPGLSSFLQHFLRETITSRMVYPNIVTVRTRAQLPSTLSDTCTAILVRAMPRLCPKQMVASGDRPRAAWAWRQAARRRRIIQRREGCES
jgi:hypothetical protein